jgi:hypothetical protein
MSPDVAQASRSYGRPNSNRSDPQEAEMLRAHRLTATAVVAAALLAPTGTAAGPPIDLRSPDAAAARLGQDLRSPDAAAAQPGQDLRSPDVRLGLPARGSAAPDVQLVAADPEGFAWSDAGLGAAGMLVLVLAPLAATVAIHRRRSRRLPVATH